jgi:hypothetical protein
MRLFFVFPVSAPALSAADAARGAGGDYRHAGPQHSPANNKTVSQQD